MGGVQAFHLGVVEVNHAAHVGLHLGLAGVVSPGIAICRHAQREVFKQLGTIALFVAQHDEIAKAVIALLEPVAVLVRSDDAPVILCCNARQARVSSYLF
ncbi:hypothetical protein D3C72_1941600 [compost metagenome]